MNHPELIITNSRTITMNDLGEEANSFAVSNGRIVQIGDPSALLESAGPDTRIVNLGGRTVVPGFIDAHAHLELLAYSWGIAVNCRSSEVSSISDIVNRISAASAQRPAGAWIMGHGQHFQDQSLAERRYPDRYDLDRASTEHPIVLRFSLHMNIFNSRALELLGVDGNTPDAPGGRIEHDEVTGEPTGRTFDMYSALGGPVWPFEEFLLGMRKAQELYHASGVTTVGDFPIQGPGLEALFELDKRGELSLRVTTYPKLPDAVSLDGISGLKERFHQVGGELLRLGGIKIFLDGGLTAAAAALHDPYPDHPGYRGELAYELAELVPLVRQIADSDLQVAIHAIGDRALDIALEALSELPSREDAVLPPHRIEHGGNLFSTPARIGKFLSNGILPVPQPSFIHTTAEGYRQQLGEERGRYLIPLKTLLDAGLRLPGNSDAVGLLPDQHAPMFSIWAAVNRIATSGATLDKEESITVDQALWMYTRDAAYALGLEADLGSLEVGKRADFTVLDQDPRRVPPLDLRGVAVGQTWVGGNCVFESSEFHLIK
jgi:predicted amidohydrolase YtcJ